MPSLIKSVVHGSAWLFIANFVTKALNIVLTLVLIRGLGVNDYGFLVTVWAAAALLAGGLDLGMSQALLREGARDNRLIGPYIKHIVSIRLPLTLVTLFAVVVSERVMIEYVYPEIYFSPLVLLALAALVPIVDSWQFPFVFMCHIFNKFRTVTIYRCLYFIFVVILVSLAVLLFHSVEIVVFVYVVVTFAAMILFYKNVAPLIPKHSTIGLSFKHAVGQGVPFLGINVLSLAYTRIELLLLSAMLSTSEAGIYNAQYQIILLFYMVPGLVYNTLMPNLYKNSDNLPFLRDAFSKICRYLNLYALVLTPVVIYLATTLLAALGGEALKGESSGLRILALFLLLLSSTASLNFLNVLDLLKKRIIYESIGLVLLMISGMIVIPIYKINGIAIAAVISYGITSVLAFSHLYRLGIVDLKCIGNDIVKVLPAVGLASLVLFYGTPNLWLNAALYVMLSLIFLSIFRYWTKMDSQILSNGISFFKT
jgi:O-antigen/teichoic acid export membrane protein